jgi:pyruvate dehydrogenase E2 component (dihydrolipoamide acetyltransferase)
MPALGADMESGTVVEWHVQPGSRVSRGDVVVVVETDKGAIDVEIFEDGTVAELVVQPGTKVPVGTVLAWLETDRAAPSATPAEVDRREAPRQAPEPAREVEGEGPVSAPPTAPRVRISPAARVRAKELGIDVGSLRGTGADGAITLEDVQKAAASSGSAKARVEEGGTSSMRDAIAVAMTRSKREIPHYYLSTTADVTAAVDWLAAHNAAVPVTERLIFAALLVKAVALACSAQEGFSGFYRDGRFEAAPAVHVGVAVAIRGGGLVAPAILDTATKPLPALMNEFRDLVARARAGRLRASELAAPTIVLTSLGDSPVEAVLPIIQPPQVAIVGAGAVSARPWVLGGQLAVRQLCTLSLGADHRVTDGRLGAQFLGRIARLVSAPDSPVWSPTA